jgi:hypothetical protein
VAKALTSGAGITNHLEQKLSHERAINGSAF